MVRVAHSQEWLRLKALRRISRHRCCLTRLRTSASGSAFFLLPYQARSQGLILWLRTDPAFDPLRTDPRYTDLVRRIGFPDKVISRKGHGLLKPMLSTTATGAQSTRTASKKRFEGVSKQTVAALGRLTLTGEVVSPLLGSSSSQSIEE